MARLTRVSLASLPDLLALAARYPCDYPFFLNSTAQQLEGSQDNTRYDILLACPRQRLVLSSDLSLYLDEQRLESNDFLAALDHYHAQARMDIEDDDLPFRGGWFLYLSYELAQQIEPRLDLPAGHSALPVACAVRIPAAIIHDRRQGTTTVVCEPGEEACLAKIEQDIAQLQTMPPAEPTHSASIHEAPGEVYIEKVGRVKRYIREGDVFQVNLSRLWQGEMGTDHSVAQLYSRLVRNNPAPFAGLIQFEQGTVLSSSPERLIQRKGDWVETRPIAGTHPRLADEAADAAQRQSLMAHPKERAEHIMLIDLERNDLGRICEPGSVTVSELMVLESYAHVHHIVSNVRGRLRPTASAARIIAACFPGGTITGCPKVRCMEIIAELEAEARGAYTGSFGYLNHDGDMDLNILIRTMVVEGERIRFRAGAGIVADSDPQRELDETRAKAKGMRLALAPQ